MKKINAKVAKALELIVHAVATKNPLEVVINMENIKANSLFDVHVWTHINEKKKAKIGKINDNAKTVPVVEVWVTTLRVA